MPYLPPQSRSHEQVVRWVEEVVLAGCEVWVAVMPGEGEEEEVVGYAAGADGWLEHLYLLPHVRRRGIGTRLLERARRSCPAGLSLHVFEANTEARAFYERHGFTVVATDDGSGNMERLPSLTMRWAPAPAPAPAPSTAS
ncbi:GNAT family N-acetyltransferase [Streptomyces sp. SID5468]|nr:GNAT family N-acetyltransferase [Streptomyces sp. SID5468]MYS58794.1 GNAT family N-acetyltransferase [Streptomyces sp. SID5468]